jgi:ribosomal protein S18 acetylase RimI-like enzyme
VAGQQAAPAGYVLRELQADDLDAISRVHWRACRIAYRFMGWSYSEDEVRRWYAGKLDQWDWGRVACAGEAVIGFAAATGAHLDQLFVDPDHQRAGIGSALLQALLERGLRPVTLSVFAQNAPARAFYERFGFRQADAWWNEQDQALELLYRLD